MGEGVRGDLIAWCMISTIFRRVHDRDVYRRGGQRREKREHGTVKSRVICNGELWVKRNFILGRDVDGNCGKICGS